MEKNNYLVDVALKFDVGDRNVLRKANELLKLVATQKSLTCSESCKAVVCLELATTLAGLGAISRENAIKYSGCKKSVYINMFNIISKMLNLDKVYSVKELCLTLGVSEIEVAAVNLLEKYKAAQKLSKTELQHPMYPCAAVMAACRCNKIKTNTSKFLELSRLKKTEFEDLVQTLEKFNESSLKRSLRQKKAIVNEEQPCEDDTKNPKVKKPKKNTEAEAEAEYQEWKRRMLTE